MMLKVSTVAIALVVALSDCASAGYFDRVVSSGALTRMKRYTSINRDCQATPGTVKALAKPAHGSLVTSQVTLPFGNSRSKASLASCVGRPMQMFQISYRSVPGFRGVDTFSVQATWGNGSSEVDTFSISVK